MPLSTLSARYSAPKHPSPLEQALCNSAWLLRCPASLRIAITLVSCWGASAASEERRTSQEVTAAKICILSAGQLLPSVPGLEIVRSSAQFVDAPPIAEKMIDSLGQLSVATAKFADTLAVPDFQKQHDIEMLIQKGQYNEAHDALKLDLISGYLMAASIRIEFNAARLVYTANFDCLFSSETGKGIAILKGII